jgi:hypothetical protein
MCSFFKREHNGQKTGISKMRYNATTPIIFVSDFANTALLIQFESIKELF